MQAKKVMSPKDTIKAGLKIDIKEHFHINSYQTNDPTLIKTTITANSDKFKQLNNYFPADKLLKFEFSNNEVRVYEGTVYLGLTLAAIGDIQPGEYTIPIKVNYQACDDKVCYPPKSITSDLKIKISSSTGADANTAIFKNINFTTPTITEVKQETTDQNLKENPRTTTAPSEESQVSDFVAEKGLPLGLVIIFLGGLALNLTPCVYPLILSHQLFRRAKQRKQKARA